MKLCPKCKSRVRDIASNRKGEWVLIYTEPKLVESDSFLDKDQTLVTRLGELRLAGDGDFKGFVPHRCSK